MADTSPRNVTGRGLGLYAGKTSFWRAKYRNGCKKSQLL
jgi:hypothetical protein